MAIRFDAAADQLFAPAPAALDPMTVMFNLYLEVDVNAAGWLFTIANADVTGYLVVVLGADGTQLLIFSSAGFSTGVALATGTWYHVAMTKNGNIHTLFVDGVSVDTLNVALSFTPAFVIFGSNGTDYFNGRLDGMKYWTADIGAGGVVAERVQRMAMRSQELYAVWALQTAADLTDYSGAGRALTTGGALTDAANNPNVAWNVTLQSKSGLWG